MGSGPLLEEDPDGSGTTGLRGAPLASWRPPSARGSLSRLAATPATCASGEGLSPPVGERGGSALVSSEPHRACNSTHAAVTALIEPRALAWPPAERSSRAQPAT
jgi:hypothetical protein